MTTQRILVMGDNHGNAESLRRVVEATKDETFDFIIHVGDLTNATYTDDPNAGRAHLEAIAPHFEALAERGTLIYIWGNRDGYGRDVPHDVLTAGTLLHEETRTIDGQRFTTDPTDVTSDTILLTHPEYPELLDHFEGRAYFSGHEHRGRYKGRCLNSAFLYRDNLHGADELLGGYFIVEVTDDPPFNVEFNNLSDLKRIICPDHNERGVLFQPAYHNCAYCYYDGTLEEELTIAAYYGLNAGDHDTITIEEVTAYALSLFESPPDGLEASLASFLRDSHNQRVPFDWREADTLTPYESTQWRLTA